MCLGHELQERVRLCEHQGPIAALADLLLGGALSLEEGNHGEERRDCSVEETEKVGWLPVEHKGQREHDVYQATLRPRVAPEESRELNLEGSGSIKGSILHI